MSSERSNIYIDVSSGQVVLGGPATDNHIESGGHPADLQSLSDFLTGNSANVISEPLNVEDWSNEDYLTYGRWLNNLIRSGHESPPRLNQKVLRKGYALGIGPSIHRISAMRRFGSTSKYYAELGASNTHRIGNFKNTSSKELVAYLRDVGSGLGRPPNVRDINRRAHNNPSRPTSSIYYDRFGLGGWNKARELAGFVVIDNWDDDDYYNWGVKFMKANEGLIPTARHIRILSGKKFGPSDRGVMIRFKSLKDYQRVVWSRFEEMKLAQEQRDESLREEIAVKISTEEIPSELFEDVGTEQELFARYAKYNVVDALLPDLDGQRKINVASEAYEDVSYAGSIRKINDAITVGDIESTASYLGLFDYIWDIDTLSEKLKLCEDEIFGVRKVNAKNTLQAELNVAA